MAHEDIPEGIYFGRSQIAQVDRLSVWPCTMSGLASREHGYVSLQGVGEGFGSGVQLSYPFDRTVESIALGDHSGYEQSK